MFHAGPTARLTLTITTGSRAPAFVQAGTDDCPPAVGGARARQSRARPRQTQRRSRTPKLPPCPDITAWQPPESGIFLQTARKPVGTAGIWIEFEGRRWEHRGEAIVLDSARFVRVGDYDGFPVYADPHTPYLVYLPVRGKLVTPFRRME
jgi:hypothetical protein